MIVGVSGTRKAPKEFAAVALNLSPWKITQIIQGEGGNIDEAAKAWALEHQIKCVGYPAQWQCFDRNIMPVTIKYHKGRMYNAAAGPFRNQLMVSAADAFIFVWNGTSTGTKDCMDAAAARHLPRMYYNYITGHVELLDMTEKEKE